MGETFNFKFVIYFGDDCTDVLASSSFSKELTHLFAIVLREELHRPINHDQAGFII